MKSHNICVNLVNTPSFNYSTLIFNVFVPINTQDIAPVIYKFLQPFSYFIRLCVNFPFLPDSSNQLPSPGRNLILSMSNL